MRIKINHISKTEGHSGFEGALLQGDIAQARVEVQEGARLIEGLVLGRHFSDIPIITARICGICPVIHNITAIKAIENAFAVKVTSDIVKLRQIMLLAQIIHSHALHLFFFSLPDFKGKSGLALVKKYPKPAEQALRLRQFANKILTIIGGRAIHPVRSEVGGFKNEINFVQLEKTISESEKILSDALGLADFFKNLNYPKFFRQTKFVALSSKGEYAIYGGEIKINSKKSSLQKFLQTISETEVGVVKRVTCANQAYMVGALARVTQNYSRLNPKAQKIQPKIPAGNTHYNVLAQAIEIVHAVEEIQKIWRSKIGPKIQVAYKVKAGRGLAACEAPRGTLLHSYEIDKDGLIQKSNIITPTAQFLNNLEADLKTLLPQTKRWNSAKREARVKMLIRAYDPCFTCATH